MTTLLHSRISRFVAVIGIACLSTVGISKFAIAAVFEQKEVNPDNFIVLATPYGSNSYQLLILEQLKNERPCWSESGSDPTIVEPLLTQFDFTGICSRSTDSNGYSVRMAGRDFGLVYDLDVVKRDNDLVLIATNIRDRDAAVLEVARTNGIPPAGELAKFILAPGWRLTKRVDDNKELGHVYLTRDTLPPDITASAFVDTQSHWARAYIDALAAKGIVSGFSEDGTFRPDDPVTRVQFAAIVNQAFSSLVSPQRAASEANFKDVAPSFWGKDAIQQAYALGFMSGYPDNTFKPNQQIPRVEVLVALSSGLKYASADLSLLSYYQDAERIPEWAQSAIVAATVNKIVVDYPRVKQLNPNQTATRAEVAAFVYQALVAAGQMPNIPSPYVPVVNSGEQMAPATPENQSPPVDSTSPLIPTTPATPITPAKPTPDLFPAPIEAPSAPSVPSTTPSTPSVPEVPQGEVPQGVVIPSSPVTP